MNLLAYSTRPSRAYRVRLDPEHTFYLVDTSIRAYTGKFGFITFGPTLEHMKYIDRLTDFGCFMRPGVRPHNYGPSPKNVSSFYYKVLGDIITSRVIDRISP